MTPEDQTRLVAQLKTDEGCKLYVYQDSLGYATLGFGRLVDRKKGGGISMDEALYLLQNDVAKVTKQLTQYTWYSGQDSVRQAALANFCFNVGLEGLLHFPKFLMHMTANEYPQAVAELRDTPWHSQVGARADRIMNLITTGSWT